MRPWHLKYAIGFLAISGAWTWIGVWWLVIRQRDLVGQFLLPISLSFGVAIACFAGAFLLYRSKKWAIAAIASVPVLRWASFAFTYADRGDGQGYTIGWDYLLQLPRLLQFSLLFDLGLLVYTVFLLRYRFIR
jgi:hypothetical protein